MNVMNKEFKYLKNLKLLLKNMQIELLRLKLKLRLKRRMKHKQLT